MRDYECPKCKAHVRALAVNVAHRCPSDKQKWVQFTRVKKD